MLQPVQYIAVQAADGEVVGYVWADYQAGTLQWAQRTATGVAGYRLGEEWSGKVAEVRKRGLPLAGALTELARSAGTGPPVDASGPEAVDELARIVTETDDRRLLAQLDHGNAEAWRELADAYAALTDDDRNVRWGGGRKDANGVTQWPYPMYSKPLWRVVAALWGVGAVTPEYRWTAGPAPTVPSDGRLHPADAVRAATLLAVGERVSEGTVDEAVQSGLFDAMVVALLDCHAAQAHLVCRFCGGFPAVPVAFHAHRGLLIAMRFRKQEGPMCANCGLGVFRALTTQTLWQGWWSPFSLFFFAPLTLVRNLVTVGKVKKLETPEPGRHGRQIDPGAPIHRRPLAYVALVPVLWVLFMSVTGLASGS
ncbi:DUF6508 domain-containing protein [Streptomyces cynarae]|uniref:DUF6508 domain-containing protein n=1 Tax=Streptomyces cynarae TaxID=2981134 RepID=UPI00406CE986